MLTTTVAGRTWHFSHSIGMHVGPEGFTHPSPVEAAADGTLYVADTGAVEGAGQAYGQTKIRKLRIEDEFLSEMDVVDLTWPQGLALSRDGNIYCSDAYHHAIFAYGADGTQIAHWGEQGSGEGQFQRPAGLAFDSDDNLLVVDTGNARVQKFSKEGKPLGAWGTEGSGEGELNQPWGLTIDQAGDVYVADWANDRVQKFTPGGTFLTRFGSTIEDGGQLRRPSDVAVDSQGDVYVVDWGNNRIQIYYPDGDIISGLYGDANAFSKGAQATMDVNPDYMRAFKRVNPVELINFGRFDRPRGIAIDGQDRIAVTDCGRGRVQVYAKDKDYLVPQFNA
ncbi:MAG: DNA-binding beta-propeller fold protein YncE [Chloroflexi bacterium]|jgi:DNA-binding beta-propeller fold protein YncE|nr:MAG: DNA-binding beta-propeller fold protein YncE [Chloroflexota bacterium]